MAVSDIDSLAREIKEQADKLFPDRTDTSMFLKLYGEINEMIDADSASTEGEVADVLIMVLDYAKRHNVNIATSIRRKMAINALRKWKINELGVAKHVE